MAEEKIFKSFEEAEPFLQNFFKTEDLKQFFGSIFRNVKQKLPSAVIRGKENEIVGIAPAECKYLFYALPQNGLFFIKFRAGDKINLTGTNFTQIYNFAMNSVQRYRTFPDDYRIKQNNPPRIALSENIPEPKINIDFSESGKVIDQDTGEILELEDRINTLGYYMKKLDEKRQQFDEENADLIDTVEKLKAIVKEDFVQQEEGLIYGRLGISVSKPRISWDSKGLAEYAEQHPEINEFQKVGDPIVSFRLIKEKTERS